MNMKLYNDDCLNVLKDIEDNSIDLVVSDPSYKTTSRGNSGNSGGNIVTGKQIGRASCRERVLRLV